MLGKFDGSIIIKIDGDAEHYIAAVAKVKKSTETLNGIAKKVVIGLTTAGTAVAGLGVKYNAEMEQYRAGLATLLGDAEKAEKTLADLKDFAAKTPFELTDLANAKAKAAAYEEKLKAAYVAQAEAEDQLEKANSTLETVQKEQEGKDYGGSTASGGGVGHIIKLDKTKEVVQTATEGVQQYTEEVDKWKEKSDSAQKEVAKILNEISGSVEKTGGNITGTVKTENAERSKDTKEAFEKDLDALERAYKYGEFSTEEYYTELAKIRNEHFEEGSEEWYEYTDEILDYYDDRLTETKDKAISQIEEIGNAQKSLADKLKDSTNRTYEQYSIVEKGEELPDTFTEDLANMDVSDATMYLTELLTASEQEFKAYMEGLKRYEQEAEKYSSQVYKSEFDELAEKLKAEFGQIPEDFFDMGEDSAEAYGEGFMNQLSGIFERAKSVIALNMSQLSAQLAVAGRGTVTANTYNDSRTTNIYAPSSSPHNIIEQQKQQNIYEQHTTKWGD